jgi:hypothetical protein
MGLRTFLRRFVDVPVALGALAAVAIVWWMRAAGPSGTGGRMRGSAAALALPGFAAVVLLPWTVSVATQLPHSAVARHWNTAWAGIDIAITIGLALTSWLGRRRDHRVAPAATATATLMCADAWFDLCTSGSGFPFGCAVAEAAIELVVAAGCLVVGFRARRR